MSSQFEDVLEELAKRKDKSWEPKEIDEYLSKLKVETRGEAMVRILDRLVDDDIWEWSKFIEYKLPHIASTDRLFLDLLAKIARKVNGDLAKGFFINALANIGSRDPRLGLALSEEMARHGEELTNYSSCPLAGAGAVDFEGAMAVVKEKSENDDPNLRAISIRAITMIFERRDEPSRLSDIFGILDRASGKEEALLVRMEAAKAYVALSKFDSKACANHLIALASQNDPHIRATLVSSLLSRNLPRSEDEIEILKICATDEDENVLSMVALVLAFKGRANPEETLTIIMNWVIRSKYTKVRDVEYCLHEIGKDNLDKCINVVKSWADKRGDLRLRLFVPIILERLSSSNYERLIEIMKVWSQKGTAFQEMVVKTLREVLTAIFPHEKERQNLVDSSFLILAELASRTGADIEIITKSEPDKFYECFKLIEELEREKLELDFGKMRACLAEYPKIKEFFGDSWFYRMERQNNRTHPMLVMLSREDGEYLYHMETMIGTITCKTGKLRDLRKGLRNEDQFWQTLSEIEVISSLISNHDVEIPPGIGGKKLDAMIEINGKQVLVEVINPEMLRPLRYLRGKAIEVRNRAGQKISDELQNHFEGVYHEQGIPIVFAVDVTRSEIRRDSIEDCLEGTLRLVMLVDKRSGEFVKTYSERGEDSIHHYQKETDVLSAVICYNRVTRNDNVMRLEGRVIPNPYAKNPLSTEIIQTIERSMFG